MSFTQKNRKQLIKTALLSSPLIGLFFVMPVFLFMQTLPEEKRIIMDPNILKVLIFLTTISCAIFLVWRLNVYLLSRFQMGLGLFGFKEEKSRYVFSFLLLLAIGLPLEMTINTFRPIDIGLFKYYPIVGLIAVNFFILLLIDLILKQNETAELRLEKAELEISQLLTQQEQLKQQIQPHFLFNSLGTLRVLIKKNPQEADAYTSRLAKFLRASLSLAQSNLVSIEEEIDFLENYFNLQKMRFAEGIQLSIDIPEEVKAAGKIPVFSLQILAENAIKHNAFSVKEPMRLQVQYLPEGFLEISNNTAAKYNQEISTGIGLHNLKMRFKHFTDLPVEIVESEHKYQVKLKVL